MKKKIIVSSLLTPLFISSLIFGGEQAKASSANALGGGGAVGVTGTEVTPPRDPENPGDVADPGPGPSTTGDLRVDFVSTLNFGATSITNANRKYDSLAQLFHSDTNARGYYIQITDQRGSNAQGWNLTLTQDRQFESTIVQDLNHQQLDGAVLSFDKGWANSANTGGAPTVTRDTLSLNEMGTAYTVASATSGQGSGIWTISFGASEENTSGQENTLTALTDENGAVMDATYNKPAYSNSAVSLTIPDTTRIYPVQYTTTLTWTLEASPTG